MPPQAFSPPSVDRTGIQHTRDQPCPRGDPACQSCTTPARERHRFNKTKNQYVNGEIIKINESVHTPIESKVFKGIAQPKAATLNKSSSSLRPRGQDKGGRPGVVLSPRRIRPKKGTEDRTRTYTMLLATYTDIRNFCDLPPVLQHFCVPVSPHCEICADVEHLHTTPEWQKKNAWLIALPFSSPREVSGRWVWEDENGKRQYECSFRVDTPVCTELLNIHNRKWKEWTAKCAVEDEYVEDRYKEYEVSCRASKAWSVSPLRGFLQAFKKQGDRPTHRHGYADKSTFGGSQFAFQTNPESQLASEDPPHPPFSSHSRQTSTSRRFGNAPLLDLETGGVHGSDGAPSSTPDTGIVAWVRALQDSSPLDVPEEPHVSQTEFDSTSAAVSTESLHNEKELFGSARPAALQEATVTMPGQQEARPVGNMDASSSVRLLLDPQNIHS
ncbi:hypothetical protein LXA43DRAFT_1034253 [Ganoderma leucocontextum]|nr:hypothetical protein LXA43DRAFT_1034253 [Ganoderma leucocontextum]